MFKRMKMLRKRKSQVQSFEENEQSKVASNDNFPADKVEKNDEITLERTVYLFPASIKEVGGSKWGYINAKGKFVLAPIYDHAGDFQENGLAIVRIKNLSGVIDVNGYFIVKPKYEMINPFSEGRASVIDQQGFKVIDESGKELTTKAYDFIGDYREGRAVFANHKNDQYLYGYLNKRGKEVIPVSYDSAADFHDGKAIVKMKRDSFALINLTGRVLHMYPYPFVGEYGERMLVFQKKIGGKFGYLGEDGKILIEPRFTGAGAFSDGCAIVNVQIGDSNYYGLIDRKGTYIFKPNYHNIVHLGEKRVAIGKAIEPGKPFIGSTYAVADTNGRILTGYIYNNITKYKDGLSSSSNDHFTFFIDKTGKKVLDLPKMNGSGQLHFDKTIIKGDLDFRLFYILKNGEIIWRQNQQISLNSRYEILEKKYKPNKDFLIYYPQLKGITNQKMQVEINQSLKDLAGIKETSPSLQLESNYFGDFEIPFYKNDLLVIEVTGYDYPFGAAHGMPIKKYAHIDLKMGEMYTLRDLFLPGSQYVRAISEMIGKQINNDKQYSYVFPGSYKGIQADQPFFIKEHSLNIYFQPYDIAPYAAGFPVFTIPFEDLEKIIDQNGPFWRSFH